MTGEKVEGTDVVDVVEPDATGKHPDSVPWDKYVGIKEAWGKSKTKLSGLEEQLKGAVKPDDLTKVQSELVAEKAAHQTSLNELKNIREAGVKDLRTSLIGKGVPEADVNAMSEDALKAASKVLGYMKPGADMGTGGGSVRLTGNPMELARQAYASKK